MASPSGHVSSGGDAAFIARPSMRETAPTGAPKRESQSEAASNHHHHHIPAASSLKTPRQSAFSSIAFRNLGKDKVEKIGHRRVNYAGVVSYKKTPADQLKRGIQMGLEHFIGQISNKPVRDLLIQDFEVIESVHFPSDGSQMTVAHGSSDFRFECFAPDGFKHFRQGFGIDPSDFLISLCKEPLKDLSNPGASGSLFFLTDDDEFIIKTVDHKEAKFLKKLLPGYYMNLVQNPRTLLPKFYGLYCYQSLNKNIRLVIMNNLLPSSVKMHEKFDLKGSTFKRKASKSERDKREPTLKDLDFMDLHPKGIILDPAFRKAVMDTIEKDCRVLESFNIMDYSLLLGIHNLDKVAAEDKIQVLESASERSILDPPPAANGKNRETSSRASGSCEPPPALPPATPQTKAALVRQPSYHRRIANYPTAFEVIQGTIEAEGSGEYSHSDLFSEVEEELIKFTGGIPARSERGERLLLFLGVIDILQQYKLKKKVEHAWKSAVHDGNSVSVTRPDFYKQRFITFLSDKIFPKLQCGAKQSSRSGARPASPRQTENSSPGAALSPNSISITIDGCKSAPITRFKFGDSEADDAGTPHGATGVPGAPDRNPASVFGSPENSVLTHDPTANGPSSPLSEAPSVHPPAFSTPTGVERGVVLLDDDDSVFLKPGALSPNDETVKDSSFVPVESLQMDSKGVIGAERTTPSLRTGASFAEASSPGPATSPSSSQAGSSESSAFDSSRGSEIRRRIDRLQDSSLDSFVGDLPSELNIPSASSILYSSASGLAKADESRRRHVADSWRSSSGVFSVPTSTMKTTTMDDIPEDDRSTHSTDPTSSFVEKPAGTAPSRAVASDEDTSGISGVSPLDPGGAADAAFDSPDVVVVASDPKVAEVVVGVSSRGDVV